MSPRAQVGSRVRTLRDFSRLPAGAVGLIVEDYGTGFLVHWDQDPATNPHGITRDGFDKKTECEWLEVLL